MSLVQAIVTDKFALMSADTRGNAFDGTKIEGCHKMVRVNKQVVFGCTGGIKDNFLLFKGFCTYSDENGLSPIEGINISYNDFVDIISERFEKMYNLKHREENPIPYEIMSIVCGFNGNTFEATMFNIDDENCITKLVQPQTCPCRCVNAGRIEHFNNMKFLIEENWRQYGRNSLGEYKNILREVYKRGAIFDDTINNNIQIEVIKFKDIRE